MPAFWKPAVSRLIIANHHPSGDITVYADPARPDAWRRQPYLAFLRDWASQALPNGKRVVVRVGERNIVILPDHAVDLGAVGEDELIVLVASAPGAGKGGAAEVFAAKREAWAKLGFEVSRGQRAPLAAEGFRAGRRLD